MKVVDANVLIYAVNRAAVHHEDSRRWLDEALGGGDRVGFAWLVLTAFLRLTTSSALFDRPLSLAAAEDQAREWLDSPNAVIVHPGSAHLAQLGRLLTTTGSGGNLVNDAHLAALAVEHRGSVVSYDNDFTRFAGVRWHRPADLLHT